MTLTWIVLLLVFSATAAAIGYLIGARRTRLPDFVETIIAGKEQWETTFDALSDGIAVLDDQGSIRRANRALAQLLSSSIPSVIGLDLEETLFGESAELAQLFDEVRKGEERDPLTSLSAKLDKVFHISAARIPGGGTAQGWVVVLVEDVTQQKALEAHLIQSEKMIAVGQLVSGVAHELNNPITSISSLSESLLQRPGRSERDLEQLEVIHEQAQRAGGIVSNLLTFARQGLAEITDMDLNDVVRRTVKLIGSELKQREVELDADLDPDLPLVSGDPHQLQQVVLNLLTNAVHAVDTNPPDKPRRITVRTQPTGEDVTLIVADTGPGVADDVMPHVFTPFFTTKEPGAGTGLGLSISYGIVEDHGGKFVVRNSPEGGAVFEMTLPLATSPWLGGERLESTEPTRSTAAPPEAPT